VPLRERVLWRLLYDSAALAEEVLGLDVGDLDLANRQVRARTKGGHNRPLHFQTAAARRVPAADDLDLATGPGAAVLRDGRTARPPCKQYVKPSQAAIAALLAASDPDRRGR
jgi:site-specific recombinase XerC